MVTREDRQAALKLAKSGDLDSAYRVIFASKEASVAGKNMMEVVNNTLEDLLQEIIKSTKDLGKWSYSGGRTGTLTNHAGNRVSVALNDMGGDITFIHDWYGTITRLKFTYTHDFRHIKQEVEKSLRSLS